MPSPKLQSHPCLIALGALWLGACGGQARRSLTMAATAPAGAAAASGATAGAAAGPSVQASSGRPGSAASATAARAGNSAPPDPSAQAAPSGGTSATGGSASLSTAGHAGVAAPAATAGSGAAGAAGANAGASAEVPAAAGCERAQLASSVDAYYRALAAHDPGSLPLASNVRMTENGVEQKPGAGLWTSAGEVKFKRSALDVLNCSSVTESVIVENGTDIVLGLRLKHVDAQITEIESIVVRQGDYLSDPAALIATADDDWETVLPADQRSSREVLEQFADRYFTRFSGGGCMFASDCERFENGFSPGNCSIGLSCSQDTGPARGGLKTRLVLADTEANIGVGFTMFQGQYTDFHMFKVRGAQVHGVHAVLAKAQSPGW